MNVFERLLNEFFHPVVALQPLDDLLALATLAGEVLLETEGLLRGLVVVLLRIVDFERVVMWQRILN